MDAADLVFSGIAAQAQMIRDGEISSRELVQACLDRIEALDPRLNAWRIVLAERALAEADQADGRRDTSPPTHERPLLGVPVAVKDDLRMAGTTTAWGTSAHAGEVSDDAVVLQRLRAAGAILIGKTNVPEMTIWPFTESQTFGPTRNPWDPSRTPGGSSGGTAAAVASGMVGAGSGSDGGGSIRIPSAWCGLFGLKPGRGTVPIAPHVDAWQGLSVNGALTRSVADGALFLDAVAETPPERPYAQVVGDARPLKIAWSTSKLPGQSPWPKVDPEILRTVEATAALLGDLGHTVEQRDPDYGAGASWHFLARFVRGIRDDVDSMAHPERLEARTRGMRRFGGLVGDRTLARVRGGERALRERIWSSLGGADVLLTPATGLLPPPVGKWEGAGAFRTLNGVAGYVPFNAIFNATGQPSCSVPVGFARNGMPLAVQFTAAIGGEATLLALAAQLESARPWADRRPPVS